MLTDYVWNNGQSNYTVKKKKIVIFYFIQSISHANHNSYVTKSKHYYNVIQFIDDNNYTLNDIMYKLVHNNFNKLNINILL